MMAQLIPWSEFETEYAQNFDQSIQTRALQQVLPLLKEYKVIVLGEREFCSIDLRKWLKTMGVSFCLRLNKNQCLETENLILLMAIAYLSAIFQGTQNQKKQVQKYISRRKEPRKKYKRRSIFATGQDGEQWINDLDRHSESIEELMKLTPNKRRFYQQDILAATLIGST
jgi:Transposase DDE domain